MGAALHNLTEGLFRMREYCPPHLPSYRAIIYRYVLMKTSVKSAVARTSLLALATTFELASRYSPRMRKELSSWEHGRRVGIGVLPNGPYATLEYCDGRIYYRDAALKASSVSILFKNLDSALLIFTGQLSASQAAAENRIIIRGDNAMAMQVTRCICIVQTLLFPTLMLKAILKRPQPLTASQLARKVLVMGMLPVAMMRGAFK